MLGCAGFYLLKIENFEGQSQTNNFVALTSSNNKDSVIMLWAYHLGHPNFIYLEKMFPSLFNLISESFQREICQLSKHAITFIPDNHTNLHTHFQ